MKPNTSLASDVASLYAWLVGKMCFAQKFNPILADLYIYNAYWSQYAHENWNGKGAC